jgi:hypothetical protein
MKKAFYSGFCFMLIVILIAAIFSGCNKQLVDITYTFDRAILTLPNGEVIEGDVQSWKDYDDGDQLQVKIDGTTYLVHSEDIVLIAD